MAGNAGNDLGRVLFPNRRRQFRRWQPAEMAACPCGDAEEGAVFNSGWARTSEQTVKNSKGHAVFEVQGARDESLEFFGDFLPRRFGQYPLGLLDHEVARIIFHWGQRLRRIL